MKLHEIKLAIIGLGYVGTPLAVEFGRKILTVGFDINQSRIDDLKLGRDKTKETTTQELLAAKSLSFTSNVEDLSGLPRLRVQPLYPFGICTSKGGSSFRKNSTT